MMDAECPKCKSNDFDVLNQELDVNEKCIYLYCYCNDCEKHFGIYAELIIDTIE